MLFQDLPFAVPPALEWLFLAAGVVGAVAALWSKGLRPLWALGRKAVRAINMFEEKLELLERVAASVRPNGGTSLRDVVDRIERNTQTAAIRARAIFYLSDQAAMESDGDGNCVFVSRRWQQLTGLAPEEAQGTGWLLAVVPEDREAVQASWEAAVHEHRVFSADFHLQSRQSGVVYLVHTHAAPLVTPDGVYVGHVGTSTVLRSNQ
jgi:PAS domain S-box-containing protein